MLSEVIYVGVRWPVRLRLAAYLASTWHAACGVWSCCVQHSIVIVIENMDKKHYVPYQKLFPSFEIPILFLKVQSSFNPSGSALSLRARHRLSKHALVWIASRISAYSVLLSPGSQEYIQMRVTQQEKWKKKRCGTQLFVFCGSYCTYDLLVFGV